MTQKEHYNSPKSKPHALETQEALERFPKTISEINIETRRLWFPDIQRNAYLLKCILTTGKFKDILQVEKAAFASQLVKLQQMQKR